VTFARSTPRERLCPIGRAHSWMEPRHLVGAVVIRRRGPRGFVALRCVRPKTGRDARGQHPSLTRPWLEEAARAAMSRSGPRISSRTPTAPAAGRNPRRCALHRRSRIDPQIALAMGRTRRRPHRHRGGKQSRRWPRCPDRAFMSDRRQHASQRLLALRRAAETCPGRSPIRRSVCLSDRHDSLRRPPLRNRMNIRPGGRDGAGFLSMPVTTCSNSVCDASCRKIPP